MKDFIENTIRNYFRKLHESFTFQDNNEYDDDDESEILEMFNGYARGYEMMKCAPEEWQTYIAAYNLPDCSGKVLKQALPNYNDPRDSASMHRFYSEAVSMFPSKEYLDDFIRGAAKARDEMHCSGDQHDNKTGLKLSAMLELVKPKLLQYAQTLSKTDYTDGTIRLKCPKLEIDGFSYDSLHCIGYRHTSEMEETPWGEFEYADNDVEWSQRDAETVSFLVDVNNTWEASYEYGPYCIHNVTPNECQMTGIAIPESRFTECTPADESIERPDHAYPRMQLLITFGSAVDFEEFGDFIKNNDLEWNDDPYEEQGSFDTGYYADGDGYKYMGKKYESVIKLLNALESKVKEYTETHRKYVFDIKAYNDTHDASIITRPIEFEEADNYGWESENGEYKINFSDSEQKQAVAWIKNLLTPVFKNTPYKKLLK